MRALLMACGKTNLKEWHISYLCELGRAIDDGRQPFVFDGGFVGLNDEDESEVNLDVGQTQAWRSATRSRQGQRARPWSRPPRKAQSFRSGAVEAAHGIGFRVLAQHYVALSFEERNGLWVVVRTKPLGPDGPQAHLIVAIPISELIMPRAWAFNVIGAKAELFPLKHTNFPDASICAFTKASGAWKPEDGLLPLIDHYSLWVIKSWHRTILGWWPGPQVGACAFYRRREFVANEWCGCESGNIYSDCHQGVDMLVPESAARQEFRKLFSCDYEDRQPPKGVLQAARTRWKNLPDMAMVFAHRRAFDEPQLL